MNSAPRPYLKVTRCAWIQRGISSTSSCSTFTHSTGPIPAGKVKTSGSLNGSVVNQPRPRSQMTGGFRHSSIVVQMEKVGAKSYPDTVEVRAVPHAELADLAEQFVGGVPGEHVGQPRLHPDPHQRELPGLIPLPGHRELVVAQLDAGPVVRVIRVGTGQRHRHVQVVHAGAERRAEQRHHEPGVGGVHERFAAMLGEQLGDGPLVPGVQPHSLVPVARRGGALRPPQVVVGDDQLGERAPGGDPGQRRADPARAHQKYAHELILSHVVINRRDQLLAPFYTTEIVAEVRILC